ncbi:MAG: hypothetical protein KGJ86_05420 [Chloroflexota bacterium]|nr:hypothetical protein [Chloroflexota bacterium]
MGDAAGQCLGLTGEGIRPALFFGTRLGGLLGQALRGELDTAAVRQSYRQLVAAYKPLYEALCLGQRLLPRLPLPLVQMLLASLTIPAGPPRAAIATYLRAFALPESRTVDACSAPARVHHRRERPGAAA